MVRSLRHVNGLKTENIYILSNGGKEVHASEYGVIKRGMKKIGKN